MYPSNQETLVVKHSYIIILVVLQSHYFVLIRLRIIYILALEGVLGIGMLPEPLLYVV